MCVCIQINRELICSSNAEAFGGGEIVIERSSQEGFGLEVKIGRSSKELSSLGVRPAGERVSNHTCLFRESGFC